MIDIGGGRGDSNAPIQLAGRDIHVIDPNAISGGNSRRD